MRGIPMRWRGGPGQFLPGVPARDLTPDDGIDEQMADALEAGGLYERLVAAGAPPSPSSPVEGEGAGAEPSPPALSRSAGEGAAPRRGRRARAEE